MSFPSINSIPGLSQAAAALSNLTLVTPLLSPGYGPIDQNGNSLGDPLIFDYEGENVFELKSEITKNFIQTNSSVQYHIALNPEAITVHGFKGELSNLFPPGLPPATQVNAVLGAVGAFAPGFSVSAMNVINEANQTYTAISNAVKGAVNAWNSIVNGTPTQTKQQQMFAQFYGYMTQQLTNGLPPVLFNVQTPWAIFSPCAISGLRAIQDEKTNTMTDFFLTFEKLRFTQVLSLDALQAAGRAITQYAPNVNNGSASLTNVGF